MTNREKLETLRNKMLTAYAGASGGISIRDHVLVELIGLLLGADGQRSPAAEDAPLVAGDVVRLRSGGPAMSVLRIEPAGDARCAWFVEGLAAAQMSSFPPAALRLVEDEQRDKARSILLDRALGALMDAEALIQGRKDIDAERVKQDTRGTIEALLSEAAERA